MELNFTLIVKNNRKGFHRYIGQKRRAKEIVPPVINEKGELTTADMQKAEVLSKLFASVFTGRQASQRPTHETECVYLCCVRLHASQGPEGTS